MHVPLATLSQLYCYIKVQNNAEKTQPCYFHCRSRALTLTKSVPSRQKEHSPHVGVLGASSARPIPIVHSHSKRSSPRECGHATTKKVPSRGVSSKVQYLHGWSQYKYKYTEFRKWVAAEISFWRLCSYLFRLSSLKVEKHFAVPLKNCSCRRRWLKTEPSTSMTNFGDEDAPFEEDNNAPTSNKRKEDWNVMVALITWIVEELSSRFEDEEESSVVHRLPIFFFCPLDGWRGQNFGGKATSRGHRAPSAKGRVGRMNQLHLIHSLENASSRCRYVIHRLTRGSEYLVASLRLEPLGPTVPVLYRYCFVLRTAKLIRWSSHRCWGPPCQRLWWRSRDHNGKGTNSSFFLVCSSLPSSFFPTLAYVIFAWFTAWWVLKLGESLGSGRGIGLLTLGHLYFFFLFFWSSLLLSSLF